MAHSKKNTPTPSLTATPKALTAISEIFSIDCEKTAKDLLEKAAQAVYYENKSAVELDCFETTYQITKQEIDSVYALIKSIKPQDALETLAGSQIVVCHLLGMRKLAQPNREDQQIGVKLLRLSNDAMERLERKRNGGRQNINVTYNNSAPSIQSIITPQNNGNDDGIRF